MNRNKQPGFISPIYYFESEMGFYIGLRRFGLDMYEVGKSKGFYGKDFNDAEKIALMHSELSEALEGIRGDLMDDKLPHRKMVEVELADAVIRIMNYCSHRGLDLAQAIIEKNRYNAKRPYKHGKKF